MRRVTAETLLQQTRGFAQMSAEQRLDELAAKAFNTVALAAWRRQEKGAKQEKTRIALGAFADGEDSRMLLPAYEWIASAIRLAGGDVFSRPVNGEADGGIRVSVEEVVVEDLDRVNHNLMRCLYRSARKRRDAGREVNKILRQAQHRTMRELRAKRKK